MVRRADSEWPGTVYPCGDRERVVATGLLFRRMAMVTVEISPSEQREIEQLLRFWFDRKYCVDAILVALGWLPDKAWQPPRRRKETLPEYLKSRLIGWLDAEGKAHKPPRPGMSYGEWEALDLERRTNTAVRQVRPNLSEQGEQARRDAHEHARSTRDGPITRIRARSARQAAAMDSLLLPGAEPPTFAVAASLLPPAEMVTSRMVATFAGRRSVIARDPRIAGIVERLVAERRAPMPGEPTAPGRRAG